MPTTNYNPIPRDSDENNASEARYISAILAQSGEFTDPGPRIRAMRNPVLFDHFTYGAGAFNSHVPQDWVTTETGAATPFAPGAAALGGLAVGVTGATTNNAEEIAGKNVGWKPSTMGGIYFECRAKFVSATTATDGDFYMGLADAVTYTNGLPFVFSAATAVTTDVPTEWVGFGYTSIATSGAGFNAAGNSVGLVNCTSGTAVFTAPTDAGTTAVKDSLFHIYRVEVSTAGTATFYRDGKHVGSKASAVVATTGLTPYIVANAKASHAQTATIDWIGVGATYV